MSELFVYTTPLHDAVLDNNVKLVKTLLASGHDCTETDDESISSLELAEFLKRTEIIEMMLNQTNEMKQRQLYTT